MATRDQDESDDGFGNVTTIARPRVSLPPVGGVSFELRVVSGVDEGRTFVVSPAHPSRGLVGKSPACDMQLTDREVSRRHAAFDVIGEELRLTDLGSTNGTFVNGLRVAEAYLRGDELIALGHSTLKLLRCAEDAPPLPFVDHFGQVWGASPAMRRLYPLCARLAATSVPVVIEGETGTGKEELAEALHAEGPRQGGPFIVFDCTAVAPTLIESELFGHERGAFTGAVSTHHGVFERADGGTLLIDEIGDLPAALQSKLLRVLQRGAVSRVGAERPLKVNVRLLFATRRDLDREVQQGRFREDLFHRIAVTRIELPPLRERRGDVALLANRFWVELGGRSTDLSAELLAQWDSNHWPGNVRELKNAVLRRIALGDFELGVPEGEGPSRVAHPGRGDTIAALLARGLPLEQARDALRSEFEQRYIAHVMGQAKGNVGRAAALAGVAHRHFQRLKAKYRD